ncbi:MAG: hypothetical protein R2761_14525 [Acidimicrobiales bacterium]
MGTPIPEGGSDERGAVPRRPPSLRPHLAALAERVGRHDWNPAASEDDETAVAASCVRPLAAEAGTEPRAFLDRLADACLPAGPWAAYGADRLALRLFGPSSELRHHPAWSALLDAAVSLCRARLLPYPLLPTYLAERFEAAGGDPESWLPFIEAPEPGEARITPLRPGDVRTVVEGRADSGTRVTVRLDGTEVIGLVELAVPAGQSRATGTAVRATVECWRADDLYDLYLDIAWAFPFRSWADPELEPFFPGPAPRI